MTSRAVTTLSATTGNGELQQWKYNLPTLDDPTRGGSPDAGDPFGGNDGLNQARWVVGEPVQVYSPGYRNAYDVIFTQAGNLYTFDNGPNTGWGGLPVGEGPGGNCTGEFNESGSVGYGDGLHYVSGPGYYGGHPNPVRGSADSGLYVYSNASGAWVETASYDWGTDFPQPPVDPSLINPDECDYLIPQTEDGALAVISNSTNGITEYTATNFGGDMQGDLLAASFNGNVYRFQLNGAGSDITSQEALFSGFGSQPLDVTAQGDAEIFPGTVWAVTYGSQNITVFEPNDYDGGGGACSGVDDPDLDEDTDGYKNADEIDNGTNPCSSASKPKDNDGDLVSDLNDDDDDNDLLLDTIDPFAVNATQPTPVVTVPQDCPTDLTVNVEGCLRMDPGSFDWLPVEPRVHGCDDERRRRLPEPVRRGGQPHHGRRRWCAVGAGGQRRRRVLRPLRSPTTRRTASSSPPSCRTSRSRRTRASCRRSRPRPAHPPTSSPWASISVTGRRTTTSSSWRTPTAVLVGSSSQARMPVCSRANRRPPRVARSARWRSTCGSTSTRRPARSMPRYSVDGGITVLPAGSVTRSDPWLTPGAEMAVGVISTKNGAARDVAQGRLRRARDRAAVDGQPDPRR